MDLTHRQMVDRGIFESKGPESRSKITRVRESRNSNFQSKAGTNRYIGLFARRPTYSRMDVHIMTNFTESSYLQ